MPDLPTPSGPALGPTAARQCPVRTQLRLAPPPDAHLEPRSAVTAARLRDQRARIDLGLDSLAAAPGAIDAQGDPARTLNLLRSRTTALVVRPALPLTETRREGAADAYLRLGEPGDRNAGWVPILVRTHQVTEPANSARAHGMRFSELEELASHGAIGELTGLPTNTARKARSDHARADGVELAHHWRRLEERGLAPATGTPTGGVLDARATVWWIDLSDRRYADPDLPRTAKRVSLLALYDRAFSSRLTIADHTIARLVDPSLDPAVTPVRIAECSSCPWFRGTCRPWLEDHDHVSLLPGQAHRARIAQHAERGVHTRRDVALLDPQSAAYSDLVLHPSLPELVDDARAVVSRRPWRRRSSTSRGLREDLPLQAIEVDIDMENGPNGDAYLWGLWISRPYRGPGRQSPEYLAIDDFRPASQDVHLELTRRLADALHDLRHEAAMAGGSLALYHWSPAEFRPLAHLHRAGVLPESVLRRLGLTPTGDSLRGTEWVDLERIWKRHVITGGRSGLKAVIYVVDPSFDYEVDAPGGDHSQAYYARAVQDVAAGREASEAVHWLRTYNRSDVRATAAIRHWMRTALPALPSIARWSVQALPARTHADEGPCSIGSLASPPSAT